MPMLPVADAEAIILDAVQPLDPSFDRELVPLLDCSGRILADSIASSLDFPHWDNSAMDGYAVRFDEVEQASPETPIALTIVEEIPAGAIPQNALQPGQTARILTGSMMPAGADTVVMQERVQRNGDRIEILQAPPEVGHFVRHQGSFYRAGDRLLQSGLKIRGAELAVLAAAQCLQVPVYRRVKVGVLSTGSELVQPHETLQPGQIVDSNQFALVALLKQSGMDAIALGTVKDDRASLQQAMKAAIESCDVVISSGGVSVGDYDYVEELLGKLGGELRVRSIAIKPGKPLTFATFGTKLYFGLPGNPVSALVTFWRFVLPALEKRSGQLGDGGPHWTTAIAIDRLTSDGKRESYLWGRLEIAPQESTQTYPRFQLAAGSGSSGNLVNLAGSNALAVLPVGVQAIEPGTPITVLQIPD